MKIKLLCTLIGATLVSTTAFGAGEIKELAPNQYDCTVDELELYIMKRTENLRKESATATWEDFKKTAQLAKMTGGNAGTTPSNGSSAASVATNMSIAKTGGKGGEEVDDCPLFFEDLNDIDMSDMEMPDLGGLISGGLDSLGDLAKKQMEQLADSLMDVLKQGVCERLSTDYLTELGTDILDDKLSEEIGYTTRDITGGNFANEVVNDALSEEYGTSNAKLLNVMDEDLNKNRERYMEKALDDRLDDFEDEALDK